MGRFAPRPMLRHFTDDALRDAAQRLTLAATARELGAHSSSVSERAKRLGVTFLDGRGWNRGKASPQRKASDEMLLASYARTKSVWVTADEVGMVGQSVWDRLRSLGVPLDGHGRPWAGEDDARLIREYAVYRDVGRLNVLAKEMGRTLPFLCRQAKRLGLPKGPRTIPHNATWKYISESAAAAAWANFKRSRLGLGAYCRKKGYDDLGFAAAMKRYFVDEWDHVMELKQPRQSLYRLGRSFEYRVRDDMRSRGYIAMRSPASKSPIDILALRPGQVLFIQCKRGGLIGVSEWNELFRLARSAGAIPVLAVMPPSASGIAYFQMMEPKDGTRRRQPHQAFVPDPVVKKRVPRVGPLRGRARAPLAGTPTKTKRTPSEPPKVNLAPGEPPAPS